MPERPSDVIFGDVTIQVGDVRRARRARRARRLVDRFAEVPEASLPATCEDWASQSGAYRFFANERVDADSLVEALGRATANRAADQGRLLVIMDTTSLDYTTHPATTGLGPLDNAECQGLLLHSALVATEDGLPLGIVDARVWARVDHQGTRDATYEREPIENRESIKWLWPVAAARERLGSTAELVFVADREADLYDLYQLAHELEAGWLVRARFDRARPGTRGPPNSAWWRRSRRAQRPAPAPFRSVATMGDRPAPRWSRIARGGSGLAPPRRPYEAERERWWQDHPEAKRVAPERLVPLVVSVVLVTEENPPAGVEPLRWVLVTSLPAESLEQIQRVAASYARRWLIERIHFILKSGCRAERLQLKRAAHLTRALVLLLGVAWFLCWLVLRARAEPDGPCTLVFDDDVWPVLGADGQPWY